MVFHRADGLVVLRICAIVHLRGYIGYIAHLLHKREREMRVRCPVSNNIKKALSNYRSGNK